MGVRILVGVGAALRSVLIPGQAELLLSRPLQSPRLPLAVQGVPRRRAGRTARPRSAAV